MITLNPTKDYRYYEKNKEWFRQQVDHVNDLVTDFLETLPSIYDTSIASTRYALHYRAISRELAQLLIDSQDVYNDQYADIARTVAVWRNLGYMLGEPGEGFPPHDVYTQTNEEYRELLLAIKTGLLGGSTKENIEAGAQLFLGDEAQVYEEYLEAPDRIGKTFKFRVVVPIYDNLAGNDILSRALGNASKLIKLIKPAHTLGRVVATLVEEFDLQGCQRYQDENGNDILYSGAEHPYQGPFELNARDITWDAMIGESVFVSEHSYIGFHSQGRLGAMSGLTEEQEEEILSGIDPLSNGPLIINLGDVRTSGWLTFDYVGNRFLWPKKVKNTPHTICEAAKIFRLKRPVSVFDMSSITEHLHFKYTWKETVPDADEVQDFGFALGPCGDFAGTLVSPFHQLGPTEHTVLGGDPTLESIKIDYTPL